MDDIEIKKRQFQERVEQKMYQSPLKKQLNEMSVESHISFHSDDLEENCKSINVAVDVFHSSLFVVRI
jgi:hypothetical protein